MSVEFDVTARLKGALGEALLAEHKAAVREFFAEWCLEELRTNSPEWIPEVEYRSTFDVGRTPHSYDVCIDGEYATWYPDVFYVLRFESVPDTRRSFDPYAVEYPIEVKTGQSSELSKNQRAVMATIEQQANLIVPLRVRVDIDDLPKTFTAQPHRITNTDDGALPDYTAEDPSPATDAIGADSDSTTLSSFSTDSGHDPDDEGR